MKFIPMRIFMLHFTHKLLHWKLFHVRWEPCHSFVFSWVRCRLSPLGVSLPGILFKEVFQTVTICLGINLMMSENWLPVLVHLYGNAFLVEFPVILATLRTEPDLKTRTILAGITSEKCNWKLIAGHWLMISSSSSETPFGVLGIQSQEAAS